jgi:hypothetical protein
MSSIASISSRASARASSTPAAACETEKEARPLRPRLQLLLPHPSSSAVPSTVGAAERSKASSEEEKRSTPNGMGAQRRARSQVNSGTTPLFSSAPSADERRAAASRRTMPPPAWALEQAERQRQIAINAEKAIAERAREERERE